MSLSFPFHYCPAHSGRSSPSPRRLQASSFSQVTTVLFIRVTIPQKVSFPRDDKFIEERFVESTDDNRFMHKKQRSRCYKWQKFCIIRYGFMYSINKFSWTKGEHLFSLKDFSWHDKPLDEHFDTLVTSIKTFVSLWYLASSKRDYLSVVKFSSSPWTRHCNALAGKHSSLEHGGKDTDGITFFAVVIIFTVLCHHQRNLA